MKTDDMDDYERNFKEDLEAIEKEMNEAKAKNAAATINIKGTAAEEALKIISGERHEQYGPVEDSFAEIAAYWSVFLDTHLTSVDVSKMMILLKIARTRASRKRDNWVDIIGYAELGNRLEEN